MSSERPYKHCTVTNLCERENNEKKRKLGETSIRRRSWFFGNTGGMLTVSSRAGRESLQASQHSSAPQKADVRASPRSLHPSHLSLGYLQGFSYGAGHVCSWRRRPSGVNPPPSPRKVPGFSLHSRNNKEPSVAAACGVQCTHQNMSRVTACCALLPIYPCMTLPLSQAFSLFDPLFNAYD